MNTEVTLNRLLMSISNSVPADKFEKLISLYEVPERKHKYDILKYLHKEGVLQLEELAKNLEFLGCQEENERVLDHIKNKNDSNARQDSQGLALQVGTGSAKFLIAPQDDSASMQKKGSHDEVDWNKSIEGPEDEEIPPQQATEDEKRLMEQAIQVAKQSPDEKTPVGSVLYQPKTKENIGTGCNRMPKGCENFSWSSEDPQQEGLGTKYSNVLHSAVAAIINATQQMIKRETQSNQSKTQGDIEGSILYTTLFPANFDAQLIIEYGISKVVFLDDIYKDKLHTRASKKMLKQANIEIRRLDEHQFPDKPRYHA